jgi:hypothetical protein
MKIIKGLDRIFFLLALIAIVPSFFIGMNITENAFTTLTPEYIEWKKEYDDRVDWIYREKKRKHYGKPKTRNVKPLPPGYVLEEWLDSDIELQNIKAKKPIKYNYSPVWLNIIGGIAGSGVGFLIALFGLKGFTRGIRRLSLWIIDGFRD